MQKNKLLIKFFSSGLQAIAVQVLGAAFFYCVSIYLTKDNFGLVNWMNAVCLFITTLLGFGLEQVVVRRIAASQKSDWAAAAFFWHTIAAAFFTFLVLVLVNVFSGDKYSVYSLLPWFFAAQGLIFIGLPFKQFLNAKERFTPYGIIAVVSNSGKIVAAFILQHAHKLDTQSVIIILIYAAVFELVCLLVYVITKNSFSFKLHFKAYTKLLKESSAQYLAVIFDMSLSRMDWILLGLMSTNIVLADYSFAYRAYELARLPLFIIGPIILPRLSRLMATKNKPDFVQQQQINAFNTTEMFFAVLIPLTLNTLWIPIVTLITNGKYGETNALQFLTLSLCIPLQFFINLLWSVSFSAKKYKMVSVITIACAATNIILNLVLIPNFNGIGAAAAFLITTLLQGFLYYRLTRKQVMAISIRPVLLFVLLGAISYFIAVHINVHFAIRLLIAVSLYVGGALLSKQITKQHIYNFTKFLS